MKRYSIWAMLAVIILFPLLAHSQEAYSKKHWRRYSHQTGFIVYVPKKFNSVKSYQNGFSFRRKGASSSDLYVYLYMMNVFPRSRGETENFVKLVTLNTIDGLKKGGIDVELAYWPTIINTTFGQSGYQFSLVVWVSSDQYYNYLATVWIDKKGNVYVLESSPLRYYMSPFSGAEASIYLVNGVNPPYNKPITAPAENKDAMTENTTLANQARKIGERLSLNISRRMERVLKQ
jgi:hypothetical protein